MNRTQFGSLALCPLLAAAALFAQDTKHRPEGNQIPAPGESGNAIGWVNNLGYWETDSTAEFDAWLSDLKTWRAEHLTRMGYNDAEYRRPELQWAQRDFVQPQMMCEERY